MSRRCEISPGACLLALWFARVNGWQLLGTVLLAAAIHEAGHCLALRLLRAPIHGIRIGVLGMVLETDSSRLTYGAELLTILAGPLANLAAAVVLSRLDFPAAVGAHLVLGAFNLLPVWPLDGGRGLYTALSWMAGPEAGWRAVCWVGGVSALLLAGFLLYLMWRTGGSLWLLPAACGALAAGGRSLLGNLRD